MLEDPVRAQQLVISLFADDITVLAQHNKREIATAEAQWAVDVIANWSKEWKLELNATKSEVTFFSTWTHEANFQPSFSIANKVVPYKKSPKLFGVRYDWNLSFTAHVEEVSKAVSGKLGMLASVGNSHWGWDKHHLGQLYFAYMRTKMDYSGPGWQPWLSPTSVAVLERTQNKALRIITGQLKSSPVEALRLESSIIGYETHMRRNILKSREKAMRLPANHPRQVALCNTVPPRNKRQSWASKGRMGNLHGSAAPSPTSTPI